MRFENWMPAATVSLAPANDSSRMSSGTPSAIGPVLPFSAAAATNCSAIGRRSDS